MTTATRLPPGLVADINEELRRLRMWRHLGDETGVERCNDRLNELLNWVRRSRA